MKTVTSTMVNPNVEFTIKSIKKTHKYDNKTCYEVEFNDGKLSTVVVCKNNAWNYTMIDKDKGLKITYNDDFQNVPVSTREKTIDRTFYKIVLPISQDEINANPAIASQQNPGY